MYDESRVCLRGRICHQAPKACGVRVTTSVAWRRPSLEMSHDTDSPQWYEPPSMFGVTRKALQRARSRCSRTSKDECRLRTIQEQGARHNDCRPSLRPLYQTFQRKSTNLTSSWLLVKSESHVTALTLLLLRKLLTLVFDRQRGTISRHSKLKKAQRDTIPDTWTVLHSI